MSHYNSISTDPLRFRLSSDVIKSTDELDVYWPERIHRTKVEKGPEKSVCCRRKKHARSISV
jgi:hypothetical protein